MNEKARAPGGDQTRCLNCQSSTLTTRPQRLTALHSFYFVTNPSDFNV